MKTIIALSSAALGVFLLLSTTLVAACPLVVRAGAPKKSRVAVGGYCRINGAYTGATIPSAPGVRKRAFITNSDGDSFSIIDRNTYQVVKTLPVGDYPQALGVPPVRRNSARREQSRQELRKQAGQQRKNDCGDSPQDLIRH